MLLVQGALNTCAVNHFSSESEIVLGSASLLSHLTLPFWVNCHSRTGTAYSVSEAHPWPHLGNVRSEGCRESRGPCVLKTPPSEAILADLVCGLETCISPRSLGGSDVS